MKNDKNKFLTVILNHYLKFLKNFFIVSAFLLLIVTDSKAQSVEKKVEYIRKVYHEINSAKLRSKSFPYNNTTGVINATITIYYQDGMVRKITDIGEGDDHLAADKWSYEYYYEKGKLIFSYKVISGTTEEKDEKFQDETRQYFSLNTIIKKITNGKTTYPKNETIDNSDYGYKLMKIKSAADVKQATGS